MVLTEVIPVEKPNLGEVFDALTSDSSLDGCDGDWRASVLDNANKGDIQKVSDEFRRDGTDNEIAFRLGIWPR